MEGKTPSEVASGYDQVAENYAELEGELPWPRMRWLRDLLASLEGGTTVLDLGCGNGAPVAREIAKHHRVIGVDISERQIAWARRALPRAELRVADATALSFPPGTLDAVVSLYMLGHVPRAEHEPLLERIFVWLREGGYLLVSVEEDDDLDNVRHWLETPMFFSCFDADVALRMLEAIGFAILRQEAVVQVEGDEEVPFRWILARKPGPPTTEPGRPAP
jgi:SAM-dependent methyltransferase